MQTKKLIELLQKLVDEHEPHIDIMGEHEIMIDVWQKGYDKQWQYKGFGTNIVIQKSDDGVYDILSAKESWDAY